MVKLLRGDATYGERQNKLLKAEVHRKLHEGKLSYELHLDGIPRLLFPKRHLAFDWIKKRRDKSLSVKYDPFKNRRKQ